MHSPFFSFQLQGDKARQEDAVLARYNGQRIVLAVADGLGGHESGDLASQLLLDILARELTHSTKITDAKMQLESLGNRIIEKFQKGLADSASSGHTTLALAIIEGDQLFTAHVGDSRVYHVSGDEIWRTQDHSVVQMLVSDGEIEESEMATHPEQGRLYQSIGPTKQPRIRINQRNLKNGDWVLVCSDGFWGGVTPQELMDAAHNDSVAIIEQLAHKAQERLTPKSDNITVVAHQFTLQP